MNRPKGLGQNARLGQVIAGHDRANGETHGLTSTNFGTSETLVDRTAGHGPEDPRVSPHASVN